MNFEIAITWIANSKYLDCEYFLVSYVSKSHINIFSICQFEQMYLFLACQNVTSMEMACGALEPLLPNLQISEG